MLTQCERLGTPISRALAQFADALRTKRMMTAEEKAAKTPVKLLFPLVLFIFPAMFVVILGPAGIALAAAFEYSAN
jgi:tight adherence protein C